MTTRAHMENAVSPAARRASVNVMATASNSCQLADIISIAAPILSRSGVAVRWSMKGAMKSLGSTRYERPTAPCQTPTTFAVRRTTCGTSCGRPAPIAWPTRMAPALATPNAGMNDTELIWSAIMNAASVVVPSPATRTLMKKLKARNSKNQFRPTGRPKRSRRMNSPQTNRTRRKTRGAPTPVRKNTKRRVNAMPVARALASAAPRTPRAGAPRWPLISTQLPKTLSPIARTLATAGSRVFPSPP